MSNLQAIKEEKKQLKNKTASLRIYIDWLQEMGFHGASLNKAANHINMMENANKKTIKIVLDLLAQPMNFG